MEIVAIALGVAAVMLIFAPEVVLTRVAIEPSAGAQVIAQLYGAALFGLAMTAWIGRTLLLGGIYGRAIVVGGFAHALVGVFALAHVVRASMSNALVWGACATYAVLALWFGSLMFGRGPASPAGEGST